MNKYITGSLIFIAGAGIGFGVSYYINKKHFEKRLDEELLKNQEYYIKLAGYSTETPNIKYEYEVTKASNDDADQNFEEKPPVEDKKLHYTEQMNQRKEAVIKRDRIAYNKIPPAFEEAENEVDEVELMINNDNPYGDIKIITGDMFAHDNLGYDDETLLWWEKNKLLTTEDLEILDVPDLIGTEWKDRIGEFEPNVVYVVNHTARTKYEIIRQTDDYYDYKE